MSKPSQEQSNSPTAIELISRSGELGILDPTQLSIPMPFATHIVIHERVRIAGTSQVPNISELMSTMSSGAQLAFVREPANLIDPWAIRVEYHGSELGYVPADINEVAARLMDGGKQLEGRLLDGEKQGNWWKVYMEVSLVD